MNAGSHAGTGRPDSRKLRFRLDHLAHSPCIPTLSEIALEVIRRASRPDCTIEELSEIISVDSAMSSQLLKTVNSALYCLPRPVASISRAMSLLGLKAVRSLTLCLSLPIAQKGEQLDPEIRAYWNRSLTGALLARETSIRLRRPEPEDDLVAGLLRDLGSIVLQQSFPTEYLRVKELAAQAPLKPIYLLEETVIGLNHADVSAFLLERWGLPREFTEAVRHHHHLDRALHCGVQVFRQSQLLYFADRGADLQRLEGQHELVRELLDFATAHFHMCEEQFIEVFRCVNRKFVELTELLAVDVGACADYPVLLAHAAEALAQLSLDAGKDRAQNDAARQAAEKDARRWQRMAERLHRVVVRDRLTGVYNREFFEDAIQTEFKRARRHGELLGLLCIGIDEHSEPTKGTGRSCGDQTLKEVAGLLLRETRSEDIVARPGVDEFCIILRHGSGSWLETVAERLSMAIQKLVIRQGDGPGKASISMGGVYFFPRSSRLELDEILQAAQKNMSAARSAGSNQCIVSSLLEPEELELYRQIRGRYFSTFLMDRTGIAAEKLDAALKLVQKLGTCPGRIARERGWLSARKVRRILRERRATRLPFGTIALAHRHLSANRLYTLLAIQEEPPESLADVLVKMKELSAEDARQLVLDYYKTVENAGPALATA